MTRHDPGTDEILGITRCARCGQRLDGEVECPFCRVMEAGYGHAGGRGGGLPGWVVYTAYFLTSPLSIPFIVLNRDIGWRAKLLLALGAAAWGLIYWMVRLGR